MIRPHRRVTWILPVKNGMPYLRQTLASIAAQTHQDHQIIAWDNGSTDNTIAELHRWIPNQIPGRVFDDRPTGLGDCLSRMVAMADTELITRIDADDVAMPDRLDKQTAFMDEHRDVGLLGGGMTLMDERGRVTGEACPTYCDDVDLRWHLRKGNDFRHPTVMLRRSAVLAAGNYRDLMPGQDLDLWIRMSRVTKFANLPDTMIDYRVHGHSVSSQSKRIAQDAAQRIRFGLANVLYPGISLSRAKRLYKLMFDPDVMPVEIADVVALHRVATLSARRAGLAIDAFRQTQRYRDQMSGLMSRAIRDNAAIGMSYPLLRRLGHALNRTQKTTHHPAAKAAA